MTDPAQTVAPVLIEAHALRRKLIAGTKLRGPHHRQRLGFQNAIAIQFAAIQQRLVETLGSRRVLRTKDSYDGPVTGPRIEELLRETLVSIGRQLGWEAMDEAGRDWGARPIGEVFAKVAGPEYTPYRLAKEYVRWTRDHRAADLTATERIQWMGFIEKINQAFA